MSEAQVKTEFGSGSGPGSESGSESGSKPGSASEHETREVKVPRILCVDDEPSVLRALKRFGRSRKWDVTTAPSGQEGLAELSAKEFDIVISDMRMPEMSGAEFLMQVRSHSPEAIRILLTGYSDIQALESAVNDAGIYNYLTKPWDEHMLTEVVEGALRLRHTEQERRRLEELTNKQKNQLGRLALSLDKQVKERNIEVDQALTLLGETHKRAETSFFESLQVLNHILEWKEGRDSGRARFIAEYGEKLASKLELSREDINNTKVSAMLHRLGLLGLPDELRSKPIYALSDSERDLYKQFPVWGEMALSSAPSLHAVGKIIRHQHENVNGAGFPDGLTDRDIPTVSKILAIVGDFYDLYSGRLERNLHGIENAKHYIKEWTGKKYDTPLVNTFFDVLGDFGDICESVVVVATSELAEGNVLAEDIISSSGILLLKRGTTLNGSNIEKLINHEQKYREKFQISIEVDNC